MATRSIPRDEWTSMLDGFSRDHMGATVTLEVFSTELGDQIVADGREFRGISADEKDGENRIAVSLDDAGATHTVSSPTEIWLKDAEGDTGVVLEIRSPDGTTLLTFVPPVAADSVGS
jgi:uncharacterized protein DUF5335